MLVGTRTSFREVVDSARVASRLVKVSFREVVDSAPQASFHEVVESCLRQNIKHIQDVWIPHTLFLG